MSNNVSPSLLTLPIELINRIFDYLDTRTILLSVGFACTRLQAITNTYERLIVDLRSISKCEFHHICRILRPKNVISLILSDDDETPGQLDLFFSMYDVQQFVRLRSLSVFLNSDTFLDRILNHAIHCSLDSLSIERSRSSSHQSTTLSLLSLAMTQPALRKSHMYGGFVVL